VLEHVEDVDGTLDMCASALEPGGVLGFLTHSQTLAAFEELIWQGEYQVGFIPKGITTFTSSWIPTTSPSGWRSGA
jgi:2-polyprenyl-3-methyl-5-hydroxy-6-metoxy-1,4-benzoquinol methylase